MITSPPYYGLRSYNVEGQLGQEKSLEEYVQNTLRWVNETYRVLKPSGSLILNMAGSYLGGGGGGLHSESTAMPTVNASVPETNLRNEGNKNEPWYKARQFLDVPSIVYWRIINEGKFCCRQRTYWNKPNVPTPIRSRLKNSTETLDWYVKDADKYYFNPKSWMKKAKARDGKDNFTGGICKLGDKTTRRDVDLRAVSPRLRQTVYDNEGRGRLAPEETPLRKDTDDPETIEHNWRIVPVGERQKGFELNGREKQEHVAPFPEALIKPWIESCCPPEGTICDPFLGSGTSMRVARDLKRSCCGIELNKEYAAYGMSRCNWNNGIDGHEYSTVNIP